MKKFLKTSFLIVAILIANIGFCVTDYYWCGTDGNWDTTSAKWKINNTGDFVTFVEGNNAVFNYGDNNYTVTVIENINANNVTFNVIDGKLIGITGNFKVNVAGRVTTTGNATSSQFGGSLYMMGNVFDNSNFTANDCIVRFIPTATDNVFNFKNIILNLNSNLYFSNDIIININDNGRSILNNIFRLPETKTIIINKYGTGTLESNAVLWTTGGGTDAKIPVLTFNIFEGAFGPSFYLTSGDVANINLYLAPKTTFVADDPTVYDPLLEKVQLIKTKGYINCETDKIVGYHGILPNIAKYVIDIEKETISGVEYTILYAKKEYVDGFLFMFK